MNVSVCVWVNECLYTCMICWNAPCWTPNVFESDDVHVTCMCPYMACDVRCTCMASDVRCTCMASDVRCTCMGSDVRCKFVGSDVRCTCMTSNDIHVHDTTSCADTQKAHRQNKQKI